MPTPRFFDTSSDRREYPRTKLSEIAYIGMGPENGGLVLDVSDGGLSFHSVAPVEPATTVRFLLSLRGHSRIEGAGEVVWTNAMKNVCGLKFTSLSSGAREHLNNWTTQSKMPPAARSKPVSTMRSPAPVAEEVPVATATVPQPEVAAFVKPLFAIPTAEAEDYSEETPRISFWQTPLVFWVMVSLLSATFAIGAYFYGVHVGKSENSSLIRPALDSDSPVQPPAPAAIPPATSPDADASAPSVPGPAPEATSAVPKAANSTPRAAALTPGVIPSAPNGTQLSASKTEIATSSKSTLPSGNTRGDAVLDSRPQQQQAGKAELAAALANLNGDTGRRDSAKAVQQLWAAVKAGNASAEVILSDLYATGDGVPQNCDQARILLAAAAKTGNMEAKVKLDELESGGCQ